jgi:SsrA-binding protein
MGIKIIVKNKRASYDYQLLEKIEAGIQLLGTEVKSLRAGKANIAESFVTIDKNQQVWLQNFRIPHYEFGNVHNHQETRKRKLLLHKKEIAKIFHKVKAQNLSLIPTIVYFKRSLIKVEIALGKGKKLYDKRQDQMKRDVDRKIKQGQY